MFFANLLISNTLGILILERKLSKIYFDSVKYENTIPASQYSRHFNVTIFDIGGMMMYLYLNNTELNWNEFSTFFLLNFFSFQLASLQWLVMQFFICFWSIVTKTVYLVRQWSVAGYTIDARRENNHSIQNAIFLIHGKTLKKKIHVVRLANFRVSWTFARYQFHSFVLSLFFIRFFFSLFSWVVWTIPSTRIFIFSVNNTWICTRIATRYGLVYLRAQEIQKYAVLILA